MKEHIVTVAAKNGHTTCTPGRVHIGAGDTVQWICQSDDLVVHFDSTPFTEVKEWKAESKAHTPVATVQAGLVENTVFRPTITLGKPLGETRATWGTSATAPLVTSLGDLIVRAN